MEIMNIKKIKTIHNGYFKILEATVETSEGKNIKREIFSRESRGDSSDSVAAIVYDSKKKKYIFTKQFRVGLYQEDDKYIIEAVAGTLKKGENPEECIVREIEEELGYETVNILPIGDFYVSPGGSSEKIFLYEVFVGDKISEGGGLLEENEEIETVEMTLSEMKSYDFKDAKTIIGVKQIINNRRKNIYTILDDINFEDKCKQAKKSIENGVEVEQVLFSILQNFYEKQLYKD